MSKTSYTLFVVIFITSLIETLKRLDSTTYKYAIYGDEDLNNEFFVDIIKESQFTLLNNEATLLYYKDNTPIEIVGFTNNDETNYTILTNFIDEIDTTNYYKIVLSHKPDTIDSFINYNPNLVLSGHTLGGEINIIKPLFLNEGSKKHYKDYKKVKRNVESQQEYIEKLLRIIQENCKVIKTTKPNTKEAILSSLNINYIDGVEFENFGFPGIEIWIEI